MSIAQEQLKNILEAAIMAAEEPLCLARLQGLFETDPEPPGQAEIAAALAALAEDYAMRGVELKEVASGYRFQVRADYTLWVGRLWSEKLPRYSRAMLETLALIAYRQPITRAEIEEIRGVSVSSQMIRGLLERDWVQVLGHKDLPGRPALLGTTRSFLDYFNLKRIEELPTLAALVEAAGEPDAMTTAEASTDETPLQSLHDKGTDSAVQADDDLPGIDIADKSLGAQPIREPFTDPAEPDVSQPGTVMAGDDETLTSMDTEQEGASVEPNFGSIAMIDEDTVVGDGDAFAWLESDGGPREVAAGAVVALEDGEADAVSTSTGQADGSVDGTAVDHATHPAGGDVNHDDVVRDAGQSQAKTNERQATANHSDDVMIWDEWIPFADDEGRGF